MWSRSTSPTSRDMLVSRFAASIRTQRNTCSSRVIVIFLMDTRLVEHGIRVKSWVAAGSAGFPAQLPQLRLLVGPQMVLDPHQKRDLGALDLALGGLDSFELRPGLLLVDLGLVDERDQP